MNHIHQPDCGCDENEVNREMAIAMAKVTRAPRNALKDISNGHPDILLFQSVINLSISIPEIWRAGAASLYLRYIRDGYQTDAEDHPDPSMSSDPTWMRPLMGLLNILAGISQQKSRQQDSAVIEEICNAYSMICATVWRDLSSLLPPGPQADFRRRTVVQFMGNLITSAEFQKNMYDDTSIALVMQCWLNMSADRQHRAHAVITAYRLFNDDDPPVDVLDKAVRSVTIDMVNFRTAAILQDAKMIDDGLEDELDILSVFVRAPRPWAVAFPRARLYDSIIVAIQRQLKTGNPQHTPAVLVSGHSVLYNMAGFNKATVPILTDMMQTTQICEVVAQGLIIGSRQGTDGWTRFVSKLTHAATCDKPRCDVHPNATYITACRSRLEPMYIPILIELKKSGPTGSKAIESWEEFAAALGVSEAMLLVKWKREGQCCFPGCTKRLNTTPVEVKQCAGCKTVFYHGPSCQKGDWKRHKSECKTKT